jgi:hypothetical protein
MDKEELGDALVSEGIRLSDEKLDEVFTCMDTDSDGAISFEEFYAWYVTLCVCVFLCVNTCINDVCARMDSDRDGAISLRRRPICNCVCACMCEYTHNMGSSLAWTQTTTMS